MSLNITAPSGMTLADWADCILLDLPLGGIGRLVNEANWQDWAIQLLNNPSLPANLPNPYGFNTWTDWAERLCNDLS